MEIKEELAEVIGAFVGDGCLSKYKRTDRDAGFIKELVFTGSWGKDSLYYKEIIQPTIIKNFGVKGSIKHRKDDSIRFRIFNQNIFPFFLNLGFKFGPKAHNVTIPEIVLNDIKLHKAFLRGLFNTDGTIYKRYSKKYRNHAKFYPHYKIIQFKSASQKLIEQVHKILFDLEFNPNRIIKDKNAWVCRITSQEHVNKFGKTIITTHKYHIKRFMEE